MNVQGVFGRVDLATLNLSKLNRSFKTPFLNNNISNITFTSQLTKSRISLKTLSGSCKTQMEALHAPIEFDDTFYKVLGISDPENATFSDIEKAFKQMEKKYHPKDAPRKKIDKYTKRFVRVHDAYQTLSHPQKRALYDKEYKKIVQQREWKTRCAAQLEGLKLRAKNPRSWAARVHARMEARIRIRRAEIEL